MVNKVKTATVIGLKAYEVSVETDVQNGLPAFSVVGLPDVAISESRDRIRSAVKNSGFSFPKTKIIINLAPADLKKVGTSFDLPMAVGILIEEEVLEPDIVNDYAFIGELSLNGDIRSVRGVLPLVIGLKEIGIKNVIVPFDNAKEAALAGDINVYGAQTLNDVVNHFTEEKLSPVVADIDSYLSISYDSYEYDFKDVKGQQKAKKSFGNCSSRWA